MKKLILYIILFSTVMGCVEPFEINTEIPDGQIELVVEATLSDEMKRHQVRLSRPRDFAVVNEVDSIYDPSYRPDLQNLGRNTFEPEENARVSVEDELGNVYSFSESESGSYISDDEFAAQQGVAYTLKISTKNGAAYISESEKFETQSEIENVYVERDSNDGGNEGIFVYVDGFSSDPNAKYFRYDYEETYKIIAPEWRPLDYVLTNYDPCALPVPTFDLDFIVREPDEQRVCYQTQSSQEVLQTTTAGLQENKVSRFPVRFINQSNYILSHRFGILVKQYAQSVEAFNFYNTLKSFSNSESVFSEVQPGILEGNVKSVTVEGPTALGYFEVASVSQQRIYFNYEDLFPGEPLPDYPISCLTTVRSISHPSYCDPGPGGAGAAPLSLIESIHAGLVAHYSAEQDSDGNYITGTTVPRACGDCTLFGSEEVPDFWIE